MLANVETSILDGSSLSELFHILLRYCFVDRRPNARHQISRHVSRSCVPFGHADKPRLATKLFQVVICRRKLYFHHTVTPQPALDNHETVTCRIFSISKAPVTWDCHRRTKDIVSSYDSLAGSAAIVGFTSRDCNS